MNNNIIEQKGFKYLETKGGDEHLMLLHGLFGALSNFEGILEHFGNKYNVVIPLLPIYEMPLINVSVVGLVKYVEEFVKFKGYNKTHVLGNSLGGHIALLYTLANQDKVNTVTLTGSSGLFEDSMGNSFPRRNDYEFIKRKAESTFYDPNVATKELVDELFSTVNDRNKAIRIVATAKSAVRHNLGDKLHSIKVPTLLVWGKQDTITPPFVGEKFNELIENSELHKVDKCGHAPMMERPNEFNTILENFLKAHSIKSLGETP